MTDTECSEIRAAYRDAKNPSKQVGILADLYDCTKADIRRILGLEKPGPGSGSDIANSIHAMQRGLRGLSEFLSVFAETDALKNSDVDALMLCQTKAMAFLSGAFYVKKM